MPLWAACQGWGVTEATPPLARVLQPSAICGHQTVAHDSSYCIKVAIQGLGCAGLEEACCVFSKQSFTTHKRQNWY